MIDRSKHMSTGVHPLFVTILETAPISHSDDGDGPDGDQRNCKSPRHDSYPQVLGNNSAHVPVERHPEAMRARRKRNSIRSSRQRIRSAGPETNVPCSSCGSHTCVGSAHHLCARVVSAELVEHSLRTVCTCRLRYESRCVGLLLQ